MLSTFCSERSSIWVRSYVVLVPADHDELFGNVAKVVDRLLVADVAQANHPRDGSGVEVLSEFLGQVVAFLGNVQVGY